MTASAAVPAVDARPNPDTSPPGHDVSVLIATWDGREMLETALRSLEAAGCDLRLQVIVFDNGSKDGTLEMLDGWSSTYDLVTVRSDRNIGFAEANNRALAASDAPLLLLLNNDTSVDGALLSGLRWFDAHPDVAVAQGLILDADGERVDSAGSFMTRLGFLHHAAVGQPAVAAGPPGRVFSVKGAAMWVRRAVIAEIGLFDPDAFAYFEESDLCWRCWVTGWEVRYDPSLPAIRHLGGMTSRRLGDEVYEFHSYKNRIRAVLVNSSVRTLPVLLPTHLALCSVAALLAIVSRRPRGARNIWRAVRWNWASAPATMARRRAVQGRRRRTDAEVFALAGIKVDWLGFVSLGRHWEAQHQPTEAARVTQRAGAAGGTEPLPAP